MLEHTLLPPDAIEALRQAASLPTDKDPNARSKAIDRAIDRLRLTYPERFAPEESAQLV
jgi:hypothetical protein